MTRKEHLIAILEEEAIEMALALAQRASKALRFGLQDKEPGHDATAAERIIQEFYDLDAMIEMLQEEGALPMLCTKDAFTLKQAKKSKVEKFLEVSRSQGTLI